MRYSTGSPEADVKLAKHIEGAMKGGANSHKYLAKVYCGEICFVPKLDAPEDIKKMMAESYNEVKILGIERDYVKSYAHFLLSDNFKLSYEWARELLAKHMNDEEIKTAEILAANWKKQDKSTNKQGE